MPDENFMHSLRRLSQRVMSALARATISLVDDSGRAQLLQVQSSAMQTIDKVPRFAEYGMTSNPPKNSEAIVLFVGGDRSNGVVVATGNAQYRVTGLASGEVCIHDNTGQKVYLSQAGMVLDGGGKPVTIKNTPDVFADTPLLKCSGDILDNCNTNTRTMAGMRTVANGHTHPIVNVQTGGSTINTQPPTQAE
ncbi:phage baseplate assembly protein [Caballeronia sp. NK8]|uniref:phage baseplate assembly protein V n=1 Tax=Caballeronia sp. NK8 TaxID=140098 RepID=UPI001BB5DB83|nr:phage baseplate assembly protein V [Caballeronia sp. NK8]BCQ23164.1 phage baseplate assembly protein [Caballeronia sp. NK8]